MPRSRWRFQLSARIFCGGLAQRGLVDLAGPEFFQRHFQFAAWADARHAKRGDRN